MKRRVLTALSATTLLLVSCGGSSDPVEAYVQIAKKTNCALSDLAVFYGSDEFEAIESDEDFQPLVSEFQSLHADAADTLQTSMREMAAVDWPEYVVDDVDLFLTNLAMVVNFFEELSTAETFDEAMSMNMDAPAIDLSTSEVIKAKLGITDEQVPDGTDLEELADFCN